MNYLENAFNGFNPQVDRDAAVKLALSIIFMDERLVELSFLLCDGHEIGGMEGDPGWIIDRRDLGSSSYASWPKNTHFHANVDPRGYELVFPDFFMEVCEFHRYVNKALQEYLASNPARSNENEKIIFQLKNILRNR